MRHIVDIFCLMRVEEVLLSDEIRRQQLSGEAASQQQRSGHRYNLASGMPPRTYIFAASSASST